MKKLRQGSTAELCSATTTTITPVGSKNKHTVNFNIVTPSPSSYYHRVIESNDSYRLENNNQTFTTILSTNDTTTTRRNDLTSSMSSSSSSPNIINKKSNINSTVLAQRSRRRALSTKTCDSLALVTSFTSSKDNNIVSQGKVISNCLIPHPKSNYDNHNNVSSLKPTIQEVKPPIIHQRKRLNNDDIILKRSNRCHQSSDSLALITATTSSSNTILPSSTMKSMKNTKYTTCENNLNKRNRKKKKEDSKTNLSTSNDQSNNFANTSLTSNNDEWKHRHRTPPMERKKLEDIYTERNQTIQPIDNDDSIATHNHDLEQEESPQNDTNITYPRKHLVSYGVSNNSNQNQSNSIIRPYRHKLMNHNERRLKLKVQHVKSIKMNNSTMKGKNVSANNRYKGIPKRQSVNLNVKSSTKAFSSSSESSSESDVDYGSKNKNINYQDSDSDSDYESDENVNFSKKSNLKEKSYIMDSSSSSSSSSWMSKSDLDDIDESDSDNSDESVQQSKNKRFKSFHRIKSNTTPVQNRTLTKQNNTEISTLSLLPTRKRKPTNVVSTLLHSENECIFLPLDVDMDNRKVTCTDTSVLSYNSSAKDTPLLLSNTSYNDSNDKDRKETSIITYVTPNRRNTKSRINISSHACDALQQLHCESTKSREKVNTSLTIYTTAAHCENNCNNIEIMKKVEPSYSLPQGRINGGCLSYYDGHSNIQNKSNIYRNGSYTVLNKATNPRRVSPSPTTNLSSSSSSSMSSSSSLSELLSINDGLSSWDELSLGDNDSLDRRILRVY